MTDSSDKTPPAAEGSVAAPRADALRNREQLISTAVAVLAERPGAGMDQIAAASGFGRATLYRHFSNREDLVREIQRQAVTAGEKALEEARLDRDPAPVALRRAIAALIGIGDRYRVIAGEPGLDPGALEARPAVAGLLLGLIERGQRSAEMRTDQPPEWILSALAALLVNALRQMAAGQLEPEQAARLVASTLLEGLETPPSADP